MQRFNYSAHPSLLRGTFKVGFMDGWTSLWKALWCSYSVSCRELCLAGFVDSHLSGNCCQVFPVASGQHDQLYNTHRNPAELFFFHLQTKSNTWTVKIKSHGQVNSCFMRLPVSVYLAMKPCLMSFLPMVSRCSTELQVAVMCQETQQCTSRRRRLPVKVDVNNVGFKRLRKFSFANVFLRTQMHSTCLFNLKDTENVWNCLVSNTDCKQKLCWLARKLHRVPLSRISARYALSTAVWNSSSLTRSWGLCCGIRECQRPAAVEAVL